MRSDWIVMNDGLGRMSWPILRYYSHVFSEKLSKILNFSHDIKFPD
jgi:hypothetical protein